MGQTSDKIRTKKLHSVHSITLSFFFFFFEATSNIFNFISAHKLSRRMTEGTFPRGLNYPYYQAVILKENHFGGNEVLCGGIIVSAYQVLSVAHCFDDVNPRILKIRVGAVESSSNRGSIHKVQKLITHEKYVRGDSTFDLALLRLKEPFDYNDKVNPIKPRNGTVTTNTTIRVSGFGYDSNTNFRGTLNTLELKVENKTYCQSFVEKGQMCAVSLTDYRFQGPCVGDEGGAVVVDGQLAGIMVSGNACSVSKYSPLVFIEINHIRSWIDRHVVYDPESRIELMAEERIIACLKTKLKVTGFVDLIYALSRKVGVPISDYLSYLEPANETIS